MCLTLFTLVVLQGFIVKQDREAPARNIQIQIVLQIVLQVNCNKSN